MTALCERFVAGVRSAIERHGLPWSIVALGARAEYRFLPEPPRTGAESAAAGDPELDELLHLYLLNRGVLITPFHNMALMCPATTEADVDRHTEAFAEAVAELAGRKPRLGKGAGFSRRGTHRYPDTTEAGWRGYSAEEARPAL